MTDKQYLSIKAGDVLIYRGVGRSDLSTGDSYEVRGRTTVTKEPTIMNNEGRVIRVALHECRDKEWHLYNKEDWQTLKHGSVVEFRGYLCLSKEPDCQYPDCLTVGCTYMVREDESGEFFVFDDQSVREKIVSADLLHGDWRRVYADEQNDDTMPYDMLDVGDVLYYEPETVLHVLSYLTPQKAYEIIEKSPTGSVMIMDNEGDKHIVRETLYIDGTWKHVGKTMDAAKKNPNAVPLQKDQRLKHLDSQDYMDLIDLALEMGDREWFKDLAQRVSALV